MKYYRFNLLFTVFFILGEIHSLSAAPAIAIIQDLNRLATINSTQTALPAPIQDWRNSEFNRRYFSPWHRDRPVVPAGPDYFIKTMGTKHYYGENKQLISQEAIQQLRDAMDVGNYPSVARRAITVTNTSLRLLPTERPFFLSFDLPGSGYPFDYLQQSGLPANTPIFVTHFSTDRSWAYVEMAQLAGWIPATHFAYVTDDQCRDFEQRDQVAVIRESVPVIDSSGQFLWHARVGMIAPIIDVISEGFRIRVLKRGANGDAVSDWAVAKSAEYGRKPLPLTPETIASIGTQLMGQSYGWGDLFGNRDCSSMIQSLFVPFGVWLPRNSSDQGRFGGYFFDFKSLSPKDKEKMIMTNGVPFMTLLWLRGHIMVYVGNQDGRALAFHNIWGIRTQTADGKEARHLIGKALITTLTPGETVPSSDPDGELLSRLEGMTILVPRFY